LAVDVLAKKSDYIELMIVHMAQERIMKRLLEFYLIVVIVLVTGCAHHKKLPAEKVHTIYVADSEQDTLVSKYAPVFLSYDHQKDYNRIGTPSARTGKAGPEQIYINPEKPAIYYLQETFSTEYGTYTNLIFRIHFSKVPFSIIPFYLNSGRNVGTIVVVTLDGEERPVLVTTTATCGCYAAIIPTNYLPRRALPQDWEERPLEVYGEKLPWILDYSGKNRPRLLVHLRPGVHRVMDLDIVEGETLVDNQGFHSIQASLKQAEDLERIPIDGETTTSMYYDFGPQKGHVKGSTKIWETLLLGLISWDFFVGADKVYDDNEKYDNPFYTSLKPWNRDASDMSEFAKFLKFWGWRL